MKQNLLDLNYEDLKSFLSKTIGIEEKKLNMRTQQIFTAVYQKGLNDFSFSSPENILLLFLAGPMTVIPLFLFIKGVEKCGLSASGMIFFITPSSQFLLGYFYYNEPFSTDKFISFILIWFAVLIYLRDLYENN